MVSVTDRGAIEIDDYMRTNVPGIYAIGDVTAKLQLAHVAEAQGVVAAETRRCRERSCACSRRSRSRRGR
jgi:pyruvate/2-oxoglutarate dehydrogenase complex dihydrolipoamide dehydrogenase (E3) component